MFDGVRRGGRLPADQAVQLNQFTSGIANVEAVQVLRSQPRGAPELGDDLIFLSVELDAAEIETAKNICNVREISSTETPRAAARSRSMLKRNSGLLTSKDDRTLSR